MIYIRHKIKQGLKTRKSKKKGCKEMNEEQLKMLVEVNERSKSNTHRIDEMEKEYKLLHEMNTSIQLIAQQNATTKEDMDEVKRDISIVKTEVAEVKQAPLRQEGEMYNKIKWLVLSGVLGFLLNFILTQALK